MSAPPPVPVFPGRPAAPGLNARRCSRHGEREAVARCLGCGGAFCRECASEHDGRLLCADCLAKEAAQAAATARPRQRWFSAFGRMAALTAGVLALWGLFYGVGSVLLKIPPNFHDGTVWSDAAKRLNNPDEP